jgi:thiol:disulfide interchange protein DsbC
MDMNYGRCAALTAFALLAFAGLVGGEDLQGKAGAGPDSSVTKTTIGAAAKDAELKSKFTEQLKTVMPDPNITEVRPGPVPGLYEVHMGAEILYMSPDGRYAVLGDIYDLTDRVNLTDEIRAELRAAAFAQLKSSETIDFIPKNVHHTIFVFTDVDCTYCRRLHSEIGEFMAGGIGVRYLAFPRGGLNSEAYRKSVGVWCAEDRQQALTAAKAGEPVAQAQCDNPVSEQFELGKQIGVRGTPAVYSEDGRALGGYIPAAELIRMFESQG